MTRTMGDAIHANVPTLATVPGLDLIAGYVTGSPDIQWTAADFARFTQPIVTIDQGATGSPATATVRDVQPGAWTPAAAVQSPWSAPAGHRRTIYCNQSTLPQVLTAGWQGDLWLAIPGWQLGQPLPAAPGCTVVAVQNQLDVAGAYDLSTVPDPTWPSQATISQEDFMIIYAPSGNVYLLNGGKLHHVTDTQSLAIYQSMGIPQSTTQISAAEEAALVTDFPPGNPAITVNTTAPKVAVTGTAKPVAR